MNRGKRGGFVFLNIIAQCYIDLIGCASMKIKAKMLEVLLRSGNNMYLETIGKGIDCV